jgi:hypothetical protein
LDSVLSFFSAPKISQNAQRWNVGNLKDKIHVKRRMISGTSVVLFLEYLPIQLKKENNRNKANSLVALSLGFLQQNDFLLLLQVGSFYSNVYITVVAIEFCGGTNF